MRGLFIVDAVGSAGENDTLISFRHNGLGGYFIVRLDLRIDMLFTNPAGNQLIVLTAEVQD